MDLSSNYVDVSSYAVIATGAALVVGGAVVLCKLAGCAKDRFAQTSSQPKPVEGPAQVLSNQALPEVDGTALKTIVKKELTDEQTKWQNAFNDYTERMAGPVKSYTKAIGEMTEIFNQPKLTPELREKYQTVTGQINETYRDIISNQLCAIPLGSNQFDDVKSQEFQKIRHNAVSLWKESCAATTLRQLEKLDSLTIDLPKLDESAVINEEKRQAARYTLEERIGELEHLIALANEYPHLVPIFSEKDEKITSLNNAIAEVKNKLANPEYPAIVAEEDNWSDV